MTMLERIEWTLLALVGASCVYAIIFVYPLAWRTRSMPRRSALDALFNPPRLPGQHFDPEVVICAAVLAESGEVIRCHRHHDGLRALEDRKLAPGEHELAQGFVTSRNRYVDRYEARLMQRDAGIESVAPGGYRGSQLFSEDLY